MAQDLVKHKSVMFYVKETELATCLFFSPCHTNDCLSGQLFKAIRRLMFGHSSNNSALVGVDQLESLITDEVLINITGKCVGKAMYIRLERFKGSEDGDRGKWRQTI